MRTKAKYLIDDENCLFLADNKKRLNVNGSFSIDEGNRLIHYLNEPREWQAKYQFPEKLIFTGNWKFDLNYDLELQLTQDNSDWQASILTLKGEIVSCERDKLVFQLRSIDKNGSSRFRLLKLTGTWAANEANQIYFSVTKKESPDELTLQGLWQLNKNQQVIYTFQKADRKRKDKISSTVIFSGFWQITSANQLTYILSSGTDSKFDFKAQIETPNLYPKEGVIKYRMGIGIREPLPEKQKIISLYGTWKVSRKLGLSFDMEYADGRAETVTFGAEVNFDENNQIVFSLKNELGEKLGISVIFTHRFLKQLDGEFFLRLKARGKELGVDTGIEIPF
jgi:hypothetical protein